MARIEVRASSSDPDDQHVDDRLLAGPVGRAAAHREPDRLAQLVLARALRRAPLRRRLAGFVEEGVAILLDRNALQCRSRRRPATRRPASIATATEITPFDAILRRSFIVAPSAGRMTSPSRTSRPTRSWPMIFGPSGARRTTSPFFWTIRLGTPFGRREARLLGHVAHLAMDRHDDLRPDPVIHRRELGPAGMAGDMDMRPGGR